MNPAEVGIHAGDAASLLRAERFADALAALDRQPLAPRDSEALAMKAEAYAGLAEFDKAEALARDALAITSDSARALYARGRVADMLDRKQEAADFYAHAIAADPGFAAARYELGRLLLSSGYADQGAAALSSAYQLDPGNWRYAAGVAALQAPRQRLDGLRKAYRQGIKEQPGNIRLRTRLLLINLTFPFSRLIGAKTRVSPSVSFAAYSKIMARVPYATYVILALNVAVFAWLESHGGSSDSAVLDKYGAKDSFLIIHNGEWWRFFTPIFLHAGTTHLLVNSMSLYFVGILYERCVGPARFVVVYLLAGLGGSVASVAASNSLSVGASGAIFGIFGALGVFAFKNREVLGVLSRRLVSSVIGLSVLNLLMPLADPNIDGWAHVGGLISGIAAGLIVGPWLSRAAAEAGSPRMVDDRRRSSLVAAWVVGASLVLVLLCVIVVRVNPAGA
jgi:membrane associated rhomboid family serine protease